MDFLLTLLDHCWDILLDAAPYMLFGFAIAGMLKAFLPADFVSRHLGSGRKRDVFKAAAFGAPLPLCSCGVVPAAAGLRTQGASKGATASFLISTPETGVDSVAVTYGLLDPFMALLRPLAAVFTACVAGLAVESLDGEDKAESGPDLKPPSLVPLAKGQEPAPAAQGCGCSCGSCDSSTSTPGSSLFSRFRSGMAYAFGELLEDIGLWFLLGVFLAGLITAFLPDDLLPGLLGTGLAAKFAALAVAAPLYVCATASTPIAAALVLKGFTPGAALIFLLAGPATNAASLTMVSKVLGRRSAAIYLASILICSMILGIVADLAYQWLDLDTASWRAAAQGHEPSWFTIVCAAVLLMLVLRPVSISLWNRLRGRAQHCTSC